MALFYFKYTATGAVSEVDWTGEGVPPTPAGATVITKAQYDTEIATITAAQSQVLADARLAEDKLKRQKQAAPHILVASSTATAATKAVSSYVADGTDDHVQINQAITEVLAAGGGTVLLTPGTFNLSDKIAIPVTQSLVLKGSGRATRLKVTNVSNRYAIVFDGTSDTRVEISDLTIDGNAQQQTTGGGGIWAPGAVQCRFLNLHITSVYQYGISLRGAGNGEFGHTNYITNCLFDNSEWGNGEGTGLHFTSNDENFVTSCDFEFLGGAAAVAAGIYDQSGAQNIVNCNFTHGGVGKPAVALKDGTNSRLVGCNFDSVGGDGVFITNSGHSIIGCTFFNVGIKSAPGTDTGIHLQWATHGCVIVGNSMGACAATAEHEANSLIREDGDGGAGGNLIANNVLTGETVFGALTLGGTSSMVRGNVGAPNGDDAAPIKIVAGPVSDASFPANRPPVDGTLAVNSANGSLYVRVAGIWRSVATA